MHVERGDGHGAEGGDRPQGMPQAQGREGATSERGTRYRHHPKREHKGSRKIGNGEVAVIAHGMAAQWLEQIADTDDVPMLSCSVSWTETKEAPRAASAR